jgi:hypothetical protein
MRGVLCLTVLALAAAPAAAAEPLRFRWQPGQVLTYRVHQVTTATDTTPDAKAEMVSTLDLVKRWQVESVDAQGVATLQMSLTALKTSTRTPDGETLTFDSTNATASNVENRDELSKYVNAPLAVLRVDGRGQVVEVKESKFGPASRFESELPFRLALPEQAPAAAGESWQRSYTLVLEPPQGAGEKFPATQKYTFKGTTGTVAVVGLSTDVKPPTDTKPDQVIPLLQWQPEGDVWFDTATGRLRAARLTVKKELKEHRGPGSHYKYESSYSEDLAE